MYRRLVASQAALSRHVWTYVPKYAETPSSDVSCLHHFLARSSEGQGFMVLTGAGVSTESGIPDYRSEGVGLYARSNRRPVTYQEFVRSDAVRRRYWARNFVGWPRFSKVQPNDSHKILAQWEDDWSLTGVVTQNVDRLHHKAGSQGVIELHGTGHEVVCLTCRDKTKRDDFQMVLTQENPRLIAEAVNIRPDGDVDLRPEEVANFIVPPCSKCGGILKPDIVFFGDNVPRSRVDSVFQLLDTSDSLMVVGSSLSVFSAYRYILRATETKKPIAILNIGSTRGDKHAEVKVEGRCGEVLEKVNQMMQNK